jgi:hypothetical protein
VWIALACQELSRVQYPLQFVELSKLNGDFKRNDDKLIGAYLYRALSALRGHSYL